MRKEQNLRRTKRRSWSTRVVALLSGLALALAGFLIASPSQAAEGEMDLVTAVSNKCGEVTFTGILSDAPPSIPLTVSIFGDQSGSSFELGYQETETITTEATTVNYKAVTTWSGDVDQASQEGSVEVEPCATEPEPEPDPEPEPEPADPPAKKVDHPTVAPDAGR